MTGHGTLQVATDAMVNYGREQYEDAATYHAAAIYIGRNGQIPAGAWGELPWSAYWQQRWEKGLDHRIREARLMADHTGEHAAAMLKATADYTETDIQVALNFDLDNPYLRPYVSAYAGLPASTGVYRPGVGGSAPLFASGPIQFSPPTDLEEFRKLVGERLPGRDFVPCTTSNPTGVDLHSGVSGDNLDAFVAEYGEDLLCSEYVAEQKSPGAPRPFTDFILPAWRCAPGVIRNRAELLFACTRAYKECADAMKSDIGRVRDQWFSPGAALAWYRQAMSRHQYLTDINAELTWTADQGIQAANLLEGMRNKFAEFGHQRAKQIIELAKAVIHYGADQLGGIGNCKSDPVKALTGALTGFLDLLYLEQSQRHDQAIGLIGIDEQRRKEQGDPGTLAHDTLPFPKGSPGEWGNGKQWVANPSTGPVAS
ncbi:hypothetical protein [Krasilnikovia sp. MM14-A1259]|uniref:hypothetical protein n=1 Tax=Krasilnikovia sp. MM14-A1259 TaxID=3373539 RepID=UPI0037FA25B6